MFWLFSSQSQLQCSLCLFTDGTSSSMISGSGSSTSPLILNPRASSIHSSTTASRSTTRTGSTSTTYSDPSSPTWHSNVAYRVSRLSVTGDVMDQISPDIKLAVNECQISRDRLILGEVIGQGKLQNQHTIMMLLVLQLTNQPEVIQQLLVSEDVINVFEGSQF